MAPQLATVDVALNAFYGYPMLSPTTRSQQNKNTGNNRDNTGINAKKDNTDNNNYKRKINKIWWLHNLQLWM